MSLKQKIFEENIGHKAGYIRNEIRKRCGSNRSMYQRTEKGVQNGLDI